VLNPSVEGERDLRCSVHGRADEVSILSGRNPRGVLEPNSPYWFEWVRELRVSHSAGSQSLRV